jgi:hypothetical protein
MEATSMATSLTTASRVARSKPHGRSLLQRIVVALHESRMRQAQREIARHRHLLGDQGVQVPDDLSHFGL